MNKDNHSSKLQRDKRFLVREIAKVISCDVCDLASNPSLLRDEEENIPQPGYIGKNYWRTRLLLIGQNPAIPGVEFLAQADRPYTAALRAMRDKPSAHHYNDFCYVALNFIPTWPVYRSHFPLQECGLTLHDTAYCNLVRCRTKKNRLPPVKATRNCTGIHLERWVSFLQPKAVVFIGKWPHDQASALLKARAIPHSFINRRRSLSNKEREANRKQIVSFVRSALGI